MELPLLFRALEELGDCLAHQPRQGQAMPVGHLLQALKLFNWKGYRCSRGLHTSSNCINLMHLTCARLRWRILSDIRNINEAIAPLAG